jgi:DNA-binding protein H-NS
MKKIDWEGLSLDELWFLHEELSEALAVRIRRQKQELEQRLEQLNLRKGSPATGVNNSSVLLGKDPARRRRKYPKVLPKYQNPKSPGETWSGRGKRPRWLVSALKAGGKLEEFEMARSRG